MDQARQADEWPLQDAIDQPSGAMRLMAPAMPKAHVIIPYIERIDATGLYSNYGPLEAELGERIGRQCGAAGVALTSNGTSAIELALRAVVGEADQEALCLMPSFTFVATAHAVANAGLTPFFLDVDPEGLVLTPKIAERAIASLDRLPAAVVVVSAFGAPVDFASWDRFEAASGVPVVFDAAAAFSTLRSVPAAPVCVSLHATKLPGMGEGGAVLTANTALAERVKAMTGFGFVGTAREAKLRGGNYRISEYSAAVGLAALDVLGDHVGRFFGIGRVYRAALAGRRSELAEGFAVDWISSTVNVRVPPELVEETVACLNAASVPWRYWWGMGCHTHPAFRTVRTSELSVTQRVAPMIIGLPFHVGMSDMQVSRVVECLP